MKYTGKLVLAAVLWLSAPGAYAAMVTTAQFGAEPERARLVEIIANRDHVEQQLIKSGVNPADAVERVQQMTDQQISSLQGQISELPAGAGVSTTNLLLIIILVILIV